MDHRTVECLELQSANSTKTAKETAQLTEATISGVDLWLLTLNLITLQDILDPRQLCTICIEKQIRQKTSGFLIPQSC